MAWTSRRVPGNGARFSPRMLGVRTSAAARWARMTWAAGRLGFDWMPSGQATTLLGSEATESNLQQLAQSGALKTYRFLHLATHGKANPSVALSSAVFLAAEPDRPAPSADPAAPESAPDGQITAEQIVRTWDLDADLVVLSACESGLGRLASKFW